MTGLLGEGGLVDELGKFNAMLKGVPIIRRAGLLGLKACAWGGYRFGRWQSTRKGAARRFDESCAAVR